MKVRGSFQNRERFSLCSQFLENASQSGVNVHSSLSPPDIIYNADSKDLLIMVHVVIVVMSVISFFSAFTSCFPPPAQIFFTTPTY